MRFVLCRSTWLVDTVMKIGKPCLFVGESGTAKTVTIQQHLDALDQGSYASMNMSFSSRTHAADVQIAIEDVTEKRTKVSTKHGA